MVNCAICTRTIWRDWRATGVNPICYDCKKQCISADKAKSTYCLRNSELPVYYTHNRGAKSYRHCQLVEKFEEKEKNIDNLDQKEKKRFQAFLLRKQRENEVQVYLDSVLVNDRLKREYYHNVGNDYVRGKIKSFDSVKEIIDEHVEELNKEFFKKRNICHFKEKVIQEHIFEYNLLNAIIKAEDIGHFGADEMYAKAMTILDGYKEIMKNSQDGAEKRKEALLKGFNEKTHLLDHFISQIFVRGDVKLLSIITRNAINSIEQVIESVESDKIPMFGYNTYDINHISLENREYMKKQIEDEGLFMNPDNCNIRKYLIDQFNHDTDGISQLLDILKYQCILDQLKNENTYKY